MLKLFRRKSKPAQLYFKCNELPIHNFNEVSENDDFTYLQKNRDDVVSQHLLDAAWLGILDEFIRISKNVVAVSTLKKKRELLLLNKRLQVLVAIQINVDHGNDVTDICKQYKLNEEKIHVHVGMVKNDIARISKTLPDPEDEDQKKTGNTEFDQSIAACLKAGYQINRFSTVVTEWCAILNTIKQQKPA